MVVRTGPGVVDLSPGDQVYGLIDFHRDGAAAQYVSLPDETVVLRPTRLSQVESAALPLAALTAWQALSDHAQVRAGERVFIQGGAGGVGSLAVQLAKALGANVTATATTDDEHLVKTLGADRVVPSVAGRPFPRRPTVRCPVEHVRWPRVGGVVRACEAGRPVGHPGAAVRSVIGEHPRDPRNLFRRVTESGRAASHSWPGRRGGAAARHRWDVPPNADSRVREFDPNSGPLA